MGAMKMNDKETLEFLCNRHFEASPSRLFAAWTHQAEFGGWITPSPFHTVKTEMDLRIGGAYAVHMEGDVNGRRICGAVVGEFLEISDPHALALSWRWSLSDMPATKVSVEFVPSGSGTDLRLIHSGFVDSTTCAEYREGWQASFQNLLLLLNGQTA